MMQSLFLLVAATLAVTSDAHVTLNPNFGAAAGSHFKSSMKIPHGTHGKETTKLVLHVPHGVNSVVPEHVFGWDITIVNRQITPYINHGTAVTEAPATITWTATCEGAGPVCDNASHGGFDNAHLLELEIQIKLGCNFGVDMNDVATNDATVWMGEYATWWNVEQYVSTPGTNDGNEATDHLNWSGNVEGSASWSNATPKPSPYIFIYSSAACTNEEKTEFGMVWGTEKELIAPAENQEAIKSRAEVISMIEESELEVSELLMSSLDAKILESERSAKTASDIAIIAACLSGVMFSLIMSLFCFRAAKPNEFRRLLLSDMDGESGIGGGGGKRMIATTGEERI
jgi:hypothetical protein